MFNSWYQKNKWKISGVSVLLSLVFVLLIKLKPEEPRDIILTYIEENRQAELIENAYLLRKSEDLFNRGTAASAIGKLFSSNVKIDELVKSDSVTRYILYPKYTSNRHDFPLNPSRYLKSPIKGVSDYFLIFDLLDKQKIIAVGSVLEYSEGGSKDVINVSTEDFLVRDILLSEVIEKQRQKVKELDEADKQQRKLLASKENFKENCISAYDQECWVIQDWVKARLSDPESYEHIESTFIDQGSHAYVALKYRAKNGFGGFEIRVVEANVSWNCGLIEILSSN